MTLPTLDQLDELSRADLLALVKEFLVEVQRLQAENRELKAAPEKGRHPPATSRNSSQPPSRDEKSNRPVGHKPKQLGPPFGHAPQTRPLVDNPDRLIEAPVAWCQPWQADLRGVMPRVVVRRRLTELPPVTPVVLETRQSAVGCPDCQRVTRGALPPGLEAGRRFGPRREATGVYLKHEQHLSYERVPQVCRDLWDVEVSAGGASALLRRAGAAAQPVAAALGGQVSQSAGIGSDETRARGAGRNWWQGVFLSVVGVYSLIRASRGAQVIAEVRGAQHAECWVCDCCSAQLKAPAQRRQLCLAHHLRDWQRLLAPRPRLHGAPAMQALVRAAIHLWKRRAEWRPRGYARRVTAVARRLKRWLRRRGHGTEARRLWER